MPSPQRLLNLVVSKNAESTAFVQLGGNAEYKANAEPGRNAKPTAFVELGCF